MRHWVASWRQAGLSGVAIGTLSTVQATADSSQPSGTPGILTGFVAGNGALRWAALSADQRRHAVLADYTGYFGGRAEAPVEYVEAIWPSTPFDGGAYNAFMPPGGWTGYGPALRAPVGRIHWAGTETATRWYGYFDGAISSTEREVPAILSRL
jgi:monoamine oxidase